MQAHALRRVRIAASRAAPPCRCCQQPSATRQSLAFFASPKAREFHSTSRRFEAPRPVAVHTPTPPIEDPVLQASLESRSKEIAFAFDIDGVLYRGGEPIQGAANALRLLGRQKFRYVFLTNGGGTPETAKAVSLRDKLGIFKNETTIGKNRMIQSHTPKKGWPEHIKKNDTILITGQNPHWVRKLAKNYGFENVVTPTDIEAAHPHIYPFTSPRALDPFQDHRNEYHPLPKDKFIFNPKDPYTTEIPEESLKIDHIFVWNDPRDWSLDIQVINDALASHKGYLGTLSRKNGDKSLPNNGWQQDGQPSLWISNMDLHWKTQHPINRFGTGAFIEALKGVWKAATDGAELQYNALGKPLQVTYEYAHDKLLHMHERGKPGEKRPLRTVYMIGDNPESDIQGGNNFNPEDGTEWKSILVRTGVWNPTEAEPEPRHKPDMIANDVVDAIVWALNTEGVKISRDELLKLGHRDARLSPEELEQQERERAEKEAATLLGTRDRHHRLSALMR